MELTERTQFVQAVLDLVSKHLHNEVEKAQAYAHTQTGEDRALVRAEAFGILVARDRVRAMNAAALARDISTEIDVDRARRERLRVADPG